MPTRILFRLVRPCLRGLALVGICSLTACTALPDRLSSDVGSGDRPRPLPPPPAAWSAPLPALPHQGDLEELARWWAGFDDPLLADLVGVAEQSHPALDQALARIAQARAAQRSAGAALSPSAAAGAQVNRVAQLNPTLFIGNQASISLDAQWELDLFGAAKARLRAQTARTEAARLGWHEARVSLAAEVAQTLVGLRACEAGVDLLKETAASQARSAELSAARVQVGMEAPANLALAQAAAADGAARILAQQADCDSAVQALVVLTGLSPSELTRRLAERRGQIPQPTSLDVPAVPAQALSQRPDLAAAGQELAAAVADVEDLRAQRLPQLTLGGSIAPTLLRTGGQSFSGVAFGFGPALSWNLFDGGRLEAATDAARAGLASSRAAYALRLRGAVREVEEALLHLDAAQRRQADVLKAADGFQRYLAATEQRWKVGTASQFELEDARRNALAAQSGVINLQREAVVSWINLYKALGGGWQPGASGPEGPADGAEPAVDPVKLPPHRATASRTD